MKKYEKKIINQISNIKLKASPFWFGDGDYLWKWGDLINQCYSTKISWIQEWHNYKIHTYIIYYTSGGLDKTK